MLVEFRVKNFRSFKEEQVLSLVATEDTTLEDNKFPSLIEKPPFLLRSAVIYGANASGKSNVIKAIDCMHRLIITSALEAKPPLDIQPFRLDQESLSSPITFEMTFILDRIRYQYNFSFTCNLVSKKK
ncbi:MAG: AAA family ATPase [Acetobacter sp.]|nr:AAA family ATPase [Acetobacter sp.]